MLIYLCMSFQLVSTCMNVVMHGETLVRVGRTGSQEIKGFFYTSCTNTAALGSDSLMTLFFNFLVSHGN